mmetsp:Transcript_27066/g.87448  ORF Transcript_27066/g.87448 Transcript_27066/m.87448 type:complete len:209 (+) Transcript_27066:1827-2453(+)
MSGHGLGFALMTSRHAFIRASCVPTAPPMTTLPSSESCLIPSCAAKGQAARRRAPPKLFEDVALFERSCRRSVIGCVSNSVVVCSNSHASPRGHPPLALGHISSRVGYCIGSRRLSCSPCMKQQWTPKRQPEPGVTFLHRADLCRAPRTRRDASCRAAGSLHSARAFSTSASGSDSSSLRFDASNASTSTTISCAAARITSASRLASR